MELSKIEKLIEKYLNAETSIKEEAFLREYFLTENVPEHLEEYKSLFEYYTNSKNERYTKTIHLKSKKQKWAWLSIAASIVLLFSVYSIYQGNQNRKAEQIFAETQKALDLLSINLNKGNVAVVKLQQFETTKNKIFYTPKN